MDVAMNGGSSGPFAEFRRRKSWMQQHARFGHHDSGEDDPHPRWFKSQPVFHLRKLRQWTLFPVALCGTLMRWLKKSMHVLSWFTRTPSLETKSCKTFCGRLISAPF